MDELKRFNPANAPALFTELKAIPIRLLWSTKGTPPCLCLLTACAMKADPITLAEVLDLRSDLDSPLFAAVGRIGGFTDPYARGLMFGWDGFTPRTAEFWSRDKAHQYGGPNVLIGYEDGLAAWEAMAHLSPPNQRKTH